MDRFYVNIINHHVGYYSVFDRYTNEPAVGETLIELGNTRPDCADEPPEFRYARDAEELAIDMNRNYQDYMEHIAGLEQDVC